MDGIPWPRQNPFEIDDDDSVPFEDDDEEMVGEGVRGNGAKGHRLAGKWAKYLSELEENKPNHLLMESDKEEILCLKKCLN
jgi:hypothetical protein